MSNKNDVMIQSLADLIINLTEVQEEDRKAIELLIQASISTWERSIVETMKSLIEVWETEVPGDESLYTLGVRRCIDIVEGSSGIL